MPEIAAKNQKNNKGVRVSLPHSWRSDLRVMAEKQGTTVNKLILDAIQEKYFPPIVFYPTDLNKQKGG